MATTNMAQTKTGTRPMNEPIPAGELERRVGGEIGVSRWFEIDQTRIDAFAEGMRSILVSQRD